MREILKPGVAHSGEIVLSILPQGVCRSYFLLPNPALGRRYDIPVAPHPDTHPPIFG